MCVQCVHTVLYSAVHIYPLGSPIIPIYFVLCFLSSPKSKEEALPSVLFVYTLYQYCIVDPDALNLEALWKIMFMNNFKKGTILIYLS